MIRAERIEVGEEPVDLTAGSGGSGVSVQYVADAAPGQTALYIGTPGQGEPIRVGRDSAGNTRIPPLSLGSADRLYLWRNKGQSGPVDVVVGWA